MLSALMRVAGDAVELVRDGPRVAVAFPGSRHRPGAADRSADLAGCRVSRAVKPVLLANPVREGADDRGSAAGDIQLFVDVFKVGAHSSLGDADPPPLSSR